MTNRAKGGSRVIYVASSARELAQEVQDWLSQASVRAASCPDIYDALAQLADGKSPLALIVSIDAVDWNELDFFLHVQRLSPDTLVYVSAAEHQNAKMEAALARGARPFDADALNELLALAPPPPHPLGPAGLLAGSLRTDIETTQAAPRLVPPEPSEPAPSESEPTEPEPDEPEPGESGTQRPSMRLVSSTEAEDTQATVPFPWSPASSRPHRTPPSTGQSEEAKPQPVRRKAPPAKPPVKLTPEELAALLEQPAPEGGKAQEGGA